MLGGLVNSGLPRSLGLHFLHMGHENPTWIICIIHMEHVTYMCNVSYICMTQHHGIVGERTVCVTES